MELRFGRSHDCRAGVRGEFQGGVFGYLCANPLAECGGRQCKKIKGLNLILTHPLFKPLPQRLSQLRHRYRPNTKANPSENVQPPSEVPAASGGLYLEGLEALIPA